ncbi:MAG: hypothetical protein AAFX06_10210 [Planctomycetota bacterium]
MLSVWGVIAGRDESNPLSDAEQSSVFAGRVFEAQTSPDGVSFTTVSGLDSIATTAVDCDFPCSGLFVRIRQTTDTTGDASASDFTNIRAAVQVVN